jgi:hypothetical protein
MNAIVARKKELIELTLKGAVIYDDFDFAARTAALLERAAIRSDEAMKWDVQPWRLDLLKPSSLAAAALEETMDADLIVVALCKTHLLPDELMEWLENWAAHRQVGDAAILVLCPEETAGPRSCWNRLKEFAEWRGLLLLGSHNLRNDLESMDVVHHLWQRKQPVIPESPWLADPARATRHWGLNE